MNVTLNVTFLYVCFIGYIMHLLKMLSVSQSVLVSV